MSKGNGHKTETPDVSHIRNVEVTHETSDINVSAVLTFVLVLLISTIGVYVGMWLLFGYFQKQETTSGPRRGTMALSKEERLPPEPRLQSAPGFKVTLANGQVVNLEVGGTDKTVFHKPEAEYEAVRAQWEQALSGKLTDQSGNTTMPIEQAIKQIAAQQLPTRPSPGPVIVVRVPTASSSGRMTEAVR
jgi:hypothetical protein